MMPLTMKPLLQPSVPTMFLIALLDVDVSRDFNQPQGNSKPFAGLEGLPDDVLPH